MGKISPVSAKYVVQAHITIEGVVDRPDIIGSVFGQTEGLLGADLELRELQRSGRVGRIEVDIDVKNGKTSGTLTIPSSMDKVDTVLIAAALETIQRIGPCDAQVAVEKVEDVRVSKRGQIIDRAKELLTVMTQQTLPDSRDIKLQVDDSVKMMEVVPYGKEGLPAGPAIAESEEIIIVEGRADVLNLLRNDIKNCIAMNGTNVPQTIADLSKEKTATVFVDGDRGGDLIIRELAMIGEIDFVAKAPDGKEVEELTKKEILKALRGVIAYEQYKAEMDKNPGSHRVEARRTFEQPIQERREFVSRRQEMPFRREESFRRDDSFRRDQLRPARRPVQLDVDTIKSFKSKLDDLVGTHGAYILDEAKNILGKVPTSELGSTIGSLKGGVHAVILDGKADQELIEVADLADVKYIVCAEVDEHRPGRVKVVTTKDLN